MPVAPRSSVLSSSSLVLTGGYMQMGPGSVLLLLLMAPFKLSGKSSYHLLLFQLEAKAASHVLSEKSY